MGPNARAVFNLFRQTFQAGSVLVTPPPAQSALWYSVAEPVFGEEWTPRWTPKMLGQSGPVLMLGLVSVLVSIFQPNGIDLVDFRDFRDFRRLV